MGIDLSERFLQELRRGVNKPNVILELGLDGEAARFGYHGRNAIPVTRFTANGGFTAAGVLFAVGSDELPGVAAALKSISSLQNRIDPKSGYSTRGQLTAVIAGRENFISLIAGERLKNRRAVRKDGFIAPGFSYLDYADTFTGKILDWSRKGDDLTIVIADDLKEASAKIPEENASKTQYIDYMGMNPVDILTDILLEKLAIDPSMVDLSGFDAERDMWLSGWQFGRVLTEPREADQYLNELQVETNSYIVHDGEKITFKMFAPPAPSQSVEEWTDRNILDGSLCIKAGCRENFYNRIVVYFDYDESGGDREESYESAVIAVDAASQDASEWNETSTRVVKSRWMRSLGFSQSANISGVKAYHVSRANGVGTGTLSFDVAAAVLRWAAPGGAFGEPVSVTRDGRFQVFDADSNRYIRVIVTVPELPSANAVDTVLITNMRGDTCASALASKLLNRFRDPAATVSFDIDMNDMTFGNRFIKPADLKDLSTSEASTFGNESWSARRILLTSVRPDFSTHRVSIEAIETKMFRRYAFIAPAGHPDYHSASTGQRAYGFVGNAGNTLEGQDGYYIW